jgi:rubrerythrin
MNEITQDTEVNEINQDLMSDKSRRAFLVKMLGGAAAVTAVGAIGASPASVLAATRQGAAGKLPASDLAVLNFALTLEHLEAAFYETAAMHFSKGYLGQLVKTLRFDEEAHVNALTAAIKSNGGTPVAAAARYNWPAGVFGNRTAFLNFASTLEQTGVHAYLGQAPAIKTPSILLTAVSIVTVEARHAGAIKSLQTQNPTQGPFDQGLTTNQILKIVVPLIGK